MRVRPFFFPTLSRCDLFRVYWTFECEHSRTSLDGFWPPAISLWTSLPYPVIGPTTGSDTVLALGNEAILPRGGKPRGVYHIGPGGPGAVGRALGARGEVDIVEQTGAHLGQPEQALLVLDGVAGDSSPRFFPRSRSH
jgi:hypothetical protein